MPDQLLNRLARVNLLVAGEVGIDEYIWGDTRRISPEAPVPVIEVESQNAKLGLAANVAQNVAALGGKVTLLSVRGQDADGERLEQMLEQQGIRNHHLIQDSSRPTLRKVRVIAQKQHVVRVDYERSHVLDAELAASFSGKLAELMDSHDGIILQDYGKGIWNPDTVGFIQLARKKNKPVFVDPTRNSPLTRYRGVTLLTPNVAEAEALCGMAPLPSHAAGKDDDRLTDMAGRILRETQSDHAIITCGPDGMISISQGENRLQRIPTFAREVFDVTGAGDTVVAVLAMMHVAGYSLAQCMQIANAAAGIVVGRIGAASVTPNELAEELHHLREVGLLTSEF